MSRFSILAIAALAVVSTIPARAQAPQPAPAAMPVDPQRLAAARDLMDAMQTREMMRHMMDTMADQIQSKAAQQMLDASGVTELAKADPYFQERMRRTSKILASEMSSLMKEVEPSFIEAMAQAYARQLTVGELKQTAAFFRTSTGQKLGRIMPALMTDPSMVAAQADIVRKLMPRMPALVKRIEEATRDLPLPPKSDKPAKD